MARKFFGSLALQNRSQLQLLNSANTFAVKLQAPASLSADVSFSLPSSVGSANQVMVGDGGGQFSFSFVDNSHVAANAAIALSKLASVAAGRALVSDLSGAMSASNATAVEVGYLSGVSSSIQTQINDEKFARQTQDAATLTSAKSYTDGKISDLVNAAPGLLDTLKELADAIGDDPNFATTVATSISNEATTRQNADTALGGRIDNEASSRISADSTLTTNLAQEVTNRIDAVSAEATLRQNAVSAEATLRQNAISAEATLRSDADLLLQGQIDTLATSSSDGVAGEALIRLNADNAIKERLNTIEGAGEGSVAKAEADAKAYADSLVTDERDARLLKQAQVQIATDFEHGQRVAAEDAIDDRVDGEIATRASEVLAIQGRLNTIEGAGAGSVAKAEADAKAYADSKVAALVASAPAVLDTLKELADALNDDPNFATTVAGQIGAEASTRSTADQTLQTNINNEASTRSTADAALQTAINNEVTARQNAVTAEATARSNADTTLTTNLAQEVTDRTNAITAEASARAAEDATFLKLNGSRVMTGALAMGVNSIVATTYIDYAHARVTVQGGGTSSSSTSFTVPAGQTWSVSTYTQRVRNFQGLTGTFTLKIKSGATVLGTATIAGSSVKTDAQLTVGSGDYFNGNAIGAMTPWSFATPVSLPAGNYTAEVSVASGIFGVYWFVSNVNDTNTNTDFKIEGSSVQGSSYKITNLADGTAAADAVNKGQLDAEASARTSADSTLTTNLAAEVTARSSAVSALQSYVDGLRYKADWAAADGATKSISHGMATTDVIVQVFDKADGSSIDVEIVRSSSSSVSMTASSAPGASGWRVLVLKV